MREDTVEMGASSTANDAALNPKYAPGVTIMRAPCGPQGYSPLPSVTISIGLLITK